MRERAYRHLRTLLGIDALSLAVDMLTLRVALLEKTLLQLLSAVSSSAAPCSEPPLPPLPGAR